MITNNRVYVGDSNNKAIVISVIGTYEDIITGDVKLGNLISIDSIVWRVVHIDNTNKEFILCKETVSENTAFNSDYDSSYIGSDIAKKCAEFGTYLTPKTRNMIIPKTVYGVTGIVWIPQCDWISDTNPDVNVSGHGKGLFDYFTNDTTRIAQNDSGDIVIWWTASPWNASAAWTVNVNGSLNGNGTAGNAWLRPFIALPL